MSTSVEQILGVARALTAAGYRDLESLDGRQGQPLSEELLVRLGNHRTAVSCVYVNNPEGIALGVLGELVPHAWITRPGSKGETTRQQLPTTKISALSR